MVQFRIENLSFQYPGAAGPCLQDVNLEIRRGEFILLCGQSGSGKTTLLRHLKSVLTPYGKVQGGVFFEGKALAEADSRTQAQKIGFVMQNPDDQIVTDKVWHELAFGLENLGAAPETMGLRVAEMASFFGIQTWFHRDVDTLSGGQKQLLNLAAIMAMQPDILILDEPTSQLDPIAASDFLNTLRKINVELGTTVLLTEHRLEDIFARADRVVVMEEGRIIGDGTPASIGRILYTNRRHRLFAALPAPVRVFYEAGGEGDCPLTVREGRRWLTELYQKEAPQYVQPREELPLEKGNEPALRLKNVWFRYERKGPDILRDTAFSVPKGTIFAMVGGNGTGKSTTLKVLCGICRPYRGTVEVLGKPVRGYCREAAMLPQDPKSLFVKDTVAQELEEMGAGLEEIREMARLCGISHLLSSHPHDLSGGEQQRCALAKVLLKRPEVLLLDEPTKGLDSFFKVLLGKLLRKLRDQGVTVVMVSHDVEFCAEFADIAGMFFDGQLLAMDSPGRFFGQNSFYTTAANRMSRCVFRNAVTAEQVAELVKQNREGGL